MDASQLSSSVYGYGVMAPWVGFQQINAGSQPSGDRVPASKERTGSQTGASRLGRFLSTAGSSQLQYDGGMYSPGKGMYGFPVAINGGAGGVANIGGGSVIAPPRNNYNTYRIMDLQPTMKLARKMMAGRILTNSWTVKGYDKETPTEWVDFIDEMVMPLRYNYLDQGFRYTTFGWRPFELLWTLKEGRHWIRKIKSLRPDLTNVRTDKGGNFVGLYQHTDKVELRVERYEAFKVTHDMDSDNHYGESRHESAYEAWCHWQQTRIDQLRLSNKLAGVVPLLKYPPGQSMVNGVLVDNSVLAQEILDSLSTANGVAFQAHEWDKNDIIRNPAIAEITNWSLDFYDAGNLAPAQNGMIETAEYDDKQMLRAWEWPERAAIESSGGGSRADSSEHTNSAVSGTEMVDADLAEQFRQSPVNMALFANFGERSVDKVIVAPSPQAERKRAAAAAFLKLLVVDPVIRTAAMRAIDTNELLDLCDIPRNADFELTEDDLKMVAMNQTMNSGSGNPTGASVTTGQRSPSVVGRTTGAVSGKVVQASMKDLKDHIAELYEQMQLVEDGD